MLPVGLQVRVRCGVAGAADTWMRLCVLLRVWLGRGAVCRVPSNHTRDVIIPATEDNQYGAGGPRCLTDGTPSKHHDRKEEAHPGGHLLFHEAWQHLLESASGLGVFYSNLSFSSVSCLVHFGSALVKPRVYPRQSLVPHPTETQRPFPALRGDFIALDSLASPHLTTNNAAREPAPPPGHRHLQRQAPITPSCFIRFLPPRRKRN